MDPRSEIEMSGRAGRANRCVWAALLTGVIVSLGGCGSILGMLGTGEPRVVLKGQDSAGAAIELEKRGEQFVKARVVDAVLGTADAQVRPIPNGGVAFTIEFPAGATVSYTGVIENEGTPLNLSIGGTWIQRTSGIFGTDEGTWSASSNRPAPVAVRASTGLD